MTFGINMGVWAFDRYIRKADFAYIDFHTIKDNIKHGFVWDNDAMGTNMFIMAVCILIRPGQMDIIIGNPGYMPLEEVSCGRCSWKMNIHLPMIL